jgi:hypothetical protein
MLCCVFVVFSFVLCTLYFQFLRTVHFWLPFRYSLDCPFLIDPSVFSNVYVYTNYNSTKKANWLHKELKQNYNKTKILIYNLCQCSKGDNYINLQREYEWVMVFNATFNNIAAVSWRSVLLVEETGVPEQNHRPTSSHWQSCSHIVASSTPRHKWD